MAKNQDIQELINHIHMEFRASERSQELMEWDKLISIVINRDFDEEKAQNFFEAQACLLNTFANDLIAFMLNYFMEKEN